MKVRKHRTKPDVVVIKMTVEQAKHLAKILDESAHLEDVAHAEYTGDTFDRCEDVSNELFWSLCSEGLYK